MEYLFFDVFPLIDNYLGEIDLYQLKKSINPKADPNLSSRESFEYIFSNDSFFLNFLFCEFSSLLSRHLNKHISIVNKRTKFIKYTSGCFFSRHIDRGHANLVIQLSDSTDYGGGNLIFHHNGDRIVAMRNKYDCFLFSGNIPHEVTKIEWGTRKVISIISDIKT